MSSIRSATASATDPDTRAAHDLAELTLKQVGTDPVDNLRVLDYLGERVAAENRDGHVANSLVAPAYRFILDQQEYWWLVGNAEREARYAKVRQYFESRLPLWGIAAV